MHEGMLQAAGDYHVLVVDRSQLFGTVLVDALTLTGISASVDLDHPPLGILVCLVDADLPAAAIDAALSEVREQHADVRVLLLFSRPHPLQESMLSRFVAHGWLSRDVETEVAIGAIRDVAAGRPVQGSWETAKGRGEALTDRELSIVRLAAEGCSNAAIADELGISVNTVRTHFQNVFGKLQAENRLNAVAVARRLGMLDDLASAAAS